MNWEERCARNTLHADHPEVGDYWNEMWCPVCVVVGRTDETVSLCRKTKDVGSSRWTWDVSKVEVMTRAEFAKWLRYGGIGPLKDQVMYCVEPKSHAWVREAATKAVLGEA